MPHFTMFKSWKIKMAALLSAMVFVILFNCFSAIEYRPLKKVRYKFVAIEQGKLRGHLADDGEYLAFLGIPYAAPPVGGDRFKAPKPPIPWTGIHDAVRKVKCPQNGEGDEDCLILNVFTPLQTPYNLLPVLVYIHGGSFLLGSGPTKGMEPLIKKNIIVVTINYRLGALGFLCLGIKDAPGNAGLKDQVAALEWVKNNIQTFGGDPDQITLYGMSAGAASVEYLILANVTKGLFTKAIMESGSATSVWAVDPHPVVTAKQVAKLLKIPDTIYREILFEYYKYVDVNVLTRTNYNYYSDLTDGTFGFAPCVESQIKGIDSLITDSAYNILESGNHRILPIVFLCSCLEGLYLRSAEFYDNNYKERMEENFLDFMPADLIFSKESLRKKTAQDIRRFYFGSDPISAMDSLNYFGDYFILHGLLNSVKYHTTKCNSVYLMEFCYKGELGGNQEYYEDVTMAGHGDVIKHVILNRQPHSEMDVLTVRRISSLIANFVRHGNPTPSATAVLPETWPTVVADNISFMYLNEEFEIGNNPYEDRIAFWNNLYDKFRRPIKSVGASNHLG